MTTGEESRDGDHRADDQNLDRVLDRAVRDDAVERTAKVEPRYQRREKNPSNEEEEMRNIAAECAEYTPVYNDSLTSLSATEALERSCGTCEHFDGGECDIYQRESGANQEGDTRGRQ